MSIAEMQPPVVAVEPRHECTNCGESGVRRFCPACGEARPGAGDLSVGHFLGHAFHELVHLDSKIFRSFAYLLTRPGFLTLEYFQGRKTRYVAPLRIFLTMFAVSLIAYSIYQPMSVWDFGNMIEADRTGKLTSKMEEVAAARSIDVAVLYERITVSWQKWIARLQFINVLFLAVGLQLLYWRRGRYFVEHLVFSLHLQSALLLLSLLMWPVWLLMGFSVANPQWSVLSVVMLASLVVTVLSVHRFYAQDRLRSVLKGAAAYVVSYLASICAMLSSMIIALISVLKS